MVGMLVRLVFALLMSMHLFAQCDDVAISTKEAKHCSDVVFQGVIEGFRDAGKIGSSSFVSVACGRDK
jgi:hypothetical protein